MERDDRHTYLGILFDVVAACLAPVMGGCEGFFPLFELRAKERGLVIGGSGGLARVGDGHDGFGFWLGVLLVRDFAWLTR